MKYSITKMDFIDNVLSDGPKTLTEIRDLWWEQLPEDREKKIAFYKDKKSIDFIKGQVKKEFNVAMNRCGYEKLNDETYSLPHYEDDGWETQKEWKLDTELLFHMINEIDKATQGRVPKEDLYKSVIECLTK